LERDFLAVRERPPEKKKKKGQIRENAKAREKKNRTGRLPNEMKPTLCGCCGVLRGGGGVFLGCVGGVWGGFVGEDWLPQGKSENEEKNKKRMEGGAGGLRRYVKKKKKKVAVGF